MIYYRNALMLKYVFGTGKGFLWVCKYFRGDEAADADPTAAFAIYMLTHIKLENREPRRLARISYFDPCQATK
jgi:hypothetical protein